MSDPIVVPAVVPAATATGTTAADLPDWAQKVLTDARGEAAGYRTKLRAVEADLAAREGTLAQATAALEASKAYQPAAEQATALITKMTAALKAGIKPDADLTQFTAFVNTLQGKDEAEMVANAQSILGLAKNTLGNGRPLPDPSQGSTNNVPANDGTAKGILDAMLGN
jgi:predicted RNase H-like HicB family nuclease